MAKFQEKMKEFMQELGMFDKDETREIKRLDVAQELRQMRRDFRLVVETNREIRGENTAFRQLLLDTHRDTRSLIKEQFNMLKPEIKALHDKAQQAADLATAFASKQQALIAQVAELKAAIDSAQSLSDEDKQALTDISEDLDTSISTLASDTTNNTPTPIPDAPAPVPTPTPDATDATTAQAAAASPNT